MSLHLIPADDGLPHAPTSECGCGPSYGLRELPDGTCREAYLHRTADEVAAGDIETAEAMG